MLFRFFGAHQEMIHKKSLKFLLRFLANWSEFCRNFLHANIYFGVIRHITSPDDTFQQRYQFRWENRYLFTLASCQDRHGDENIQFLTKFQSALHNATSSTYAIDMIRQFETRRARMHNSWCTRTATERDKTEFAQ